MMATKDEELNALEKIRKIIEALGQDSYLATAFDGAFDLAEENIEYDSATSARYYIKKTEELYKELYQATRRVKSLEEEVKDLNAKIENAVRCRKYDNAINTDAIKYLNKQVQDASALAKELEPLKLENLTLKSKLYDLITVQPT